jgi:hypothetical protein
MASELQAQKFVHELEHGKGRWWVWFLVILAIIAYQVMTFLFFNPLNFQGARQENFRGLSHAKGMEQAVIARELMRGNGFSTEVIKPAAIFLVDSNLSRVGEKSPFEAYLDPKGPTGGNVPDYFHAPLNPAINALALKAAVTANDQFKWRTKEDGTPAFWAIKKTEWFPAADRIIAGVAVAFFIAAAVVNYFLARMLFDRRLALVGLMMMLLCDRFWEYAATGLPQMLMLFLFSLATLLYAKALEARENGGRPWLWVIGVGLCFGLLALSHALTLFILLGLLVHAAIAFRPYGREAGILVAVCAICFVPWIVRTKNVSGTLGGLAWTTKNYQILGSESQMMRTLSRPEATEGLSARSKVQNHILLQLDTLTERMGKNVIAVFFFLALLHSFRRGSTRSLRWAVFSMWLFGVLGMSYFGFSDYDLQDKLQANDLHVLFIPVMVFYGLALVLVLWSRVTVQDRELSRLPIFNVSFQIGLVALAAFPLLNRYTDPPRIGFSFPPYYPQALGELGEWYTDRDVICSDMPWATAWYADRKSLWLPMSLPDFNELNDFKFNSRVTGLLFTPVTGFRGLLSDVGVGEFREWRAFIMRDPRAATNFPLKAARGIAFAGAAHYLLFADRDRWTERND